MRTFTRTFSRGGEREGLLSFDSVRRFTLQVLARRGRKGLIPSTITRRCRRHFRRIVVSRCRSDGLIRRAVLADISERSTKRGGLFVIKSMGRDVCQFHLSHPRLFVKGCGDCDARRDDEREVSLSEGFQDEKRMLSDAGCVFEGLVQGRFKRVVCSSGTTLRLKTSFPRLPSRGIFASRARLLLCSRAKLQDDRTERRRTQVVTREVGRLLGANIILSGRAKRCHPIRCQSVIVLAEDLRK